MCAVLLADVAGFSALMGEDDERAARDVQTLHELVRGIVTGMHGHAQPVAGDSVFATFESVAAAVEAALQIQRRLATEDFGGRRLRIRIGVHFGDVLLRDGAAFGDAINVAARLCARARPGTICISDGVYRHVARKVDEVFEDLGRQRLKNISDPVHAYLIVPDSKGERTVRWRRPSRRAAAGTAALVTAAALVAFFAVDPIRSWRDRRASGSPAPEREASPSSQPTPAAAVEPHVTLGVMVFKYLGDGDEAAWMRDALRDGLNTSLSELSRVKVYSKEFIDFLMTRQGLTEIEVATKLGIQKILSGSYGRVGETLRIETHVVDVSTGVLESSTTTVGRAPDFLALQQKMVLDVIQRLDLPVSAAEREMLLVRRNTNMEALRLLLEAEGQGGERGEPNSGRGLAVPRWLALAAPLAPPSAHAESAEEPQRAEILAVLERYRRATEARALDDLQVLYANFGPEQRAAQERYFENVRDLRSESKSKTSRSPSWATKQWSATRARTISPTRARAAPCTSPSG